MANLDAEGLDLGRLPSLSALHGSFGSPAFNRSSPQSIGSNGSFGFWR